MSMKKLLVSVAAAGIATIAFGEWTRTAGGTYDYNDPENWADGIVDGVFGQALTMTYTSQIITLSQDHSGTLEFDVSATAKGNNYYLQSSSSAAPYPTFYLTSDPILKSIGGTLYFGFYDNKKGQDFYPTFDLCGATRVFNLPGGKGGVDFCSPFVNGNIRVEGGGSFNFRKSGSVAGDMIVGPKTTIGTNFYTNDNTPTEVTRAKNLFLDHSQFTVNPAGANRWQKISGALVVDGSNGNAGFLTMNGPASGMYSRFSANELVMTNGAVLVVRTNKTYPVGQEAVGDPDAISVTFTKTPAMVGGLLPGVRTSLSTANEGTARDFAQTFATYDAGHGVRAVTDFVQTAEEAAGKNLAVPNGTTVTFDADTEVNSIAVRATGTATKVTGSGTLTITSGQILFCSGSNGAIDNSLAFGSVQGCITAPEERKISTLNGPISGSAGLVLGTPVGIGANSGVPWQGNLALDGNANLSTYTGDTYLTGGVGIKKNGILPSGTRTGDVYVGWLMVVGADMTINGLNGLGNIAAKGRTLTIGDNDANGDFSGSVNYNNNPMAKLRKIGKGVQRLGGELILTGSIEVEQGAVVLDGTVAQGVVNVAAGAAIGGKGVINTSLSFADGATLVASKGEGKALAPLTVNGAVTAGGTVTVSAASEDWRGESCVLASTEPLTGIAFAKGANVTGIELRNDGKELWARNIRGLIVILK